MIRFLSAMNNTLWIGLSDNNHESDRDKVEILIEKTEEEEKTRENEKKDEIDTIKKLELEKIVEENIKQEIVKEITDSEIDDLIYKYKSTGKNKERAKIVDSLTKQLHHSKIQEILIDIAEDDNYPLCRAKAISNLGDLIENSDIRNLLIKKLDDISPKVRLWTVWTLRPIIHDREIQDIFIKRIKFVEKSRKIRLWMIRVLSDQINNIYIQEVFLYLFKLKPDMETRKLLLYYLLQKTENKDILFTITKQLQVEKNNEIRIEILKKLILLDDQDVQYVLENLLKTEKDSDVLELLATKL